MSEVSVQSSGSLLSSDNMEAAPPVEALAAPTTESLPTTEASPQESLLAGKYKTPEDLAKGYKDSIKYNSELNTENKTLKEQIEGLAPRVPEEYSLDFSKIEGLGNLDIDPTKDKDIQDILPVFKEAGLSQEQAETVLAGYLKSYQENVPSPADELKKLGDSASAVVGGLEKYASNMSEGDRSILMGLADSAEAAQFLHKHLVTTEQNIPGSAVSTPIKSALEYQEDAFAYRSLHESTIGADSGQQAHYNNLLKKSFT